MSPLQEPCPARLNLVSDVTFESQPPSARELQLMLIIREFWRYPVKSMAGEQPEAADIAENGLARDRISITSGRVAVGELVELISPI